MQQFIKLSFILMLAENNLKSNKKKKNTLICSVNEKKIIIKLMFITLPFKHVFLKNLKNVKE